MELTSELSPGVLDDQVNSARRGASRLVSLDVFRGITIAGMLLVNNPGKGEAYALLDHAPWNGWTPTDLVFPFFLFIVGVAIPFSMARRAPGKSRGQLLGHIWIRALSLFMLGALLHGFSYAGVALTLGQRPPGVPLFTLGPGLPEGFLLLKTVRAIAWAFIPLGMLLLIIPYKSSRLRWMIPALVTITFYLLMLAVILANHHAWNHGLPADANMGSGIFRPDHYRIPGILQRIAICYGIAATAALVLGPRMLLVMLVTLLAIYSVVMLAHPRGTPAPSLTREDNRARQIDVAVFDRYRTLPDGKREVVWKHTYGNYPDPEGLLSTIPAIGSVLLGIVVGMGLRRERPAAERCARLLAWGVVVTLLGVGLNSWMMPINKSIWTPSFVFFCGGFAMLGLGTLFYLIDVRQRRAWALPFVIYGMNAIAAFVVAGMLVRIGLIIKVERGGRPESLVTAVQHAAAGWVNQWQVIATEQNQSLAYALLFVLAVLLLMAILYMLKIFVKV